MSRTKSFFRNLLPWVFTLALIMVAIPRWASARPANPPSDAVGAGQAAEADPRSPAETTALAEEIKHAKLATPPATASHAKNKTEIIADQATQTVRIVVDGNTVAVFDGNGLHVQGNVEATGAFGPGIYSGPNARLASDGTPSQHVKGAAATPPKSIGGRATHTVRIVVDGEDVAVFDGQGLHVQGNVDSSGAFQLPIFSGAGVVAPIPASSPALRP